MTYADYEKQAAELEETNSSIWKPEPGQFIAGKIVGIEENIGQNGDSTLIEIETKDGEIQGIWLTTVLEREFKKSKAAVDDIVGIKYFGKSVAAKSGREFKNFTFKVLEKGFAAEIPM